MQSTCTLCELTSMLELPKFMGSFEKKFKGRRENKINRRIKLNMKWVNYLL